MRAIVILQARMSSTRFPEKMMRLISGLPLYLYVYQRCQVVRGVSDVVLATSDEPEDDVLAQHALESGCKVFRGSLDNVLQRYIECAKSFEADVIVRVCGDSPFLDVQWIGRKIEHFFSNTLDYVGWDHQECLPGLDSEIVRLDLLEQIISSSPTEEEREHVTAQIRKNPQSFRSELYRWEDMSDALRGMSLTVDTREDWERASWISRVLSEWGMGLRYSSKDVVRVLSHLITPQKARHLRG
ncbi:hypothetical protein HOF92_01110 [bacterium]|jgi:spore coat polysaccharide biosynthesis protein SpsF (cytidylyltransferase family)|nr:hypothetical protein [bacterium]